MQKLLIAILSLSSLLNASYNPFFGGEKPLVLPNYNIKPAPVKVVKPVPKRKNIEMSYFGFIESKKGKFALVSFDQDTIVIKQNDSLYLDEQIFKITKITTNYIHLKDRRGRIQTVYFSTKTQGRS